jgi:hypothetical protein
MSNTRKFTILHIGDDIVYNPDKYRSFSSLFDIIQPSFQERQRDTFIAALKERKWGDFHAIFRPFWNSGGEMGKWDEELVSQLPNTCTIFASAGAGYDWADIPTLSKHGSYSRSFIVIKIRLTGAGQVSLTATAHVHRRKQSPIWQSGTYFRSSEILSGVRRRPSLET